MNNPLEIEMVSPLVAGFNRIFLDKNGFVAICSKCKRVRTRSGEFNEMPIIPAGTAITHTFCTTCAEEELGTSPE